MVDILKPLVSANTVIGFLFFLLLISWFRGFRARAPGTTKSKGAGAGVGLTGIATPERIAAYEEIWRREESELWDWLEERVGMRGMAYPGGGVGVGVGVEGNEGVDSGWREKGKGEREGKEREMERRLREGEMGMGEREVDEAIKVTEERLERLKKVVGRRKMEREGGKGE